MTTHPTNTPTWNAYAARFWITTAKRALMEGQHPFRGYGYVVRCSPRCPGHKSECYAWCKNKVVAIRALAEYERSKRLGYWGCPCGSGRQAVRCCGIPAVEVKT